MTGDVTRVRFIDVSFRYSLCFVFALYSLHMLFAHFCICFLLQFARSQTHERYKMISLFTAISSTTVRVVQNKGHTLTFQKA